MSAEGDVLDKVMQDRLGAAATESCSPQGHAALVDYLVMSHQLHCETRRDVKAIRDIAEAKGNVFSNLPWGKPVKIGGIGGVLATIVYILAKMHGWIPNGIP